MQMFLCCAVYRFNSVSFFSSFEIFSPAQTITTKGIIRSENKMAKIITCASVWVCMCERMCKCVNVCIMIANEVQRFFLSLCVTLSYVITHVHVLKNYYDYYFFTSGAYRQSFFPFVLLCIVAVVYYTKPNVLQMELRFVSVCEVIL